MWEKISGGPSVQLGLLKLHLCTLLATTGVDLCFIASMTDIRACTEARCSCFTVQIAGLAGECNHGGRSCSQLNRVLHRACWKALNFSCSTLGLKIIVLATRALSGPCWQIALPPCTSAQNVQSTEFQRVF